MSRTLVYRLSPTHSNKLYFITFNPFIGKFYKELSPGESIFQCNVVLGFPLSNVMNGLFFIVKIIYSEYMYTTHFSHFH